MQANFQLLLVCFQTHEFFYSPPPLPFVRLKFCKSVILIKWRFFCISINSPLMSRILKICCYCWHSLDDSILKLLKQRRHYFFQVRICSSTSGGLFFPQELVQRCLHFAAALLCFPLSRHGTTLWQLSVVLLRDYSWKEAKLSPLFKNCVPWGTSPTAEVQK